MIGYLFKQQPTAIVRKATIAMRTHSSPKPSRKQIDVGGFTISERGKQLLLQELESILLSSCLMMGVFGSVMDAAHGCSFCVWFNSGQSVVLIAFAARR